MPNRPGYTSTTDAFVLAYPGSQFTDMFRIHFVFGVSMFVVFLITGMFMRYDFPEKETMSQELRLLLRSRHIYFLFSALIHVIIGIYGGFVSSTLKRYVQIFGSILLFVSTGLLLGAFVYENYYLSSYSNISRLGIYLGAGGVGIHLIAYFLRDRLPPTP